MRLNTQIKFFLFLLFLPVLAFSADEDFSVYIARSRLPEELAETAKSLVSNVRISHMNDKIVVYGPKSGRDAAINLMKQLDSPSKNYRVSVRAAGKGSAEREARAIEGGINVGGVKIGKRSGVLKRSGGGGTVVVGNGSGAIGATAESESSESVSRDGQTITVMDGGMGTIAAYNLFAAAMSVKVRSTGKNGARVTLQQKNRSGTGEQQMSSELDLKLGEWRNVGGVSQGTESANREALGGSKAAVRTKQDIQIMVELDE